MRLTSGSDGHVLSSDGGDHGDEGGGSEGEGERGRARDQRELNVTFDTVELTTDPELDPKPCRGEKITVESQFL